MCSSFAARSIRGLICRQVARRPTFSVRIDISTVLALDGVARQATTLCQFHIPFCFCPICIYTTNKLTILSHEECCGNHSGEAQDAPQACVSHHSRPLTGRALTNPAKTLPRSAPCVPPHAPQARRLAHGLSPLDVRILLCRKR